MAKEKTKQVSKEKTKLSYESEVALLGLLLVLVSLIALLNQGYVGSFLTYILVFLFGSCHYIILVTSIYLGGYLLVKRKKPVFTSTLTNISFIFLLIFLAIASSKFENATLNNWYSHYKYEFNACLSRPFHVDFESLFFKQNGLGGGSLGHSLYALMVTIFNEIIANLIIVTLVLVFAYLAFMKPVTYMYNLVCNYIDKYMEKRKVKKVKVLKEKNDAIFNNKKIEEENKDKKVVGTHYISFDIFKEKIFDDEEETSFNIETINEYDNKNDEVSNNLNDTNLSNINPVDENKNKYDDIYDFNDYSNEIEKEENEIFKQENSNSKEIESKPFLVSEVSEINVYDYLKENEKDISYDKLNESVQENCIKINQKLEELNIRAKVNNYVVGPCVTRYEIVLENGVRVSSLVNATNDLKLALAAKNLRMEAPIPGKSAIGIEVANSVRFKVRLKEVLETIKDKNNDLDVAIGKDLNNQSVSICIDKMPHLLIAGATGSGKSICIHSIIMSLIIKSSPDKVKLVLIDPKKVEMLPYSNLPFLLCPVITDAKKASNALKKIVKMMDARYDLFAQNGVRNIEAYNSISENKLEKIVIIIDELADLMLVASKEVEENIQRITQLARACGIHLIVATQRPSVDVITGVIKANIPSRIAFSVSSMVDSRTILDRQGAEDLLGKGDMLMDVSGMGELNRVQGVLVEDDEVSSVTNYIKNKYSLSYDEEFLNLEDDKKDLINNLIDATDNNDEELYGEVKEFVIRNQKASASLLQRYFSLGYNRAARMMDRLENEGIVSKSNGIKPRDVLVKENENEQD